MFNIKDEIATVGRNLLGDANAMLKDQRQALMEDLETRASGLSDTALARLGKIMMISAGMVTAGLLAVAAALIFSK